MALLGNQKYMKRILILATIVFLTKDTLAQWSTSGSNIYNSNSGNVGIGTATPSDKLDVQNGGIRLQRLPSSLTGGTIYGQIFQLQNLVGTADGLVYQADLHQFRNYDGAPEFTIDNGNVGIGTSSPQFKFEIVGNGQLIRNPGSTGYTTLRLYNDQNNPVRGLEIDYAGSGYSGSLASGGVAGESGLITTTGAYPLTFGTSNTARVTLLASGNVGIGTTAQYQSWKLQEKQLLVIGKMVHQETMRL
jgi:hypothetical protein